MAAPCGGDPVRCIDFVALFIVEYLKDWITLSMLLLMLGLLLRLRADRQKATEAAYATQLLAYDEKRREETQAPTWAVKDERTEER
jgi:hypothetical protein